MFCILWVIFPILAFLVDAGGASSGSAEVKAGGGGNGKAGGGGKGGKGGVMANPANQGPPNGVVMNGQPFLAQVVPVGGSIFIQQPGAPIGQAAVPQLISIGQFQSLPVRQAGAANGGPQGQPPQPANGAIPLYAILPQPNANPMGGPPPQMFIPTQQVQIIPVGGGGMPQPGGGGMRGPRAKRGLAGAEMEEFSGLGPAQEVLKTV